MSYGCIPEPGTRVKTVSTVYADPEGSGLFTMISENYEKLSAGAVGVVEDTDVGLGGTTVLIVRFPGNIRARLGPSAWELA